MKLLSIEIATLYSLVLWCGDWIAEWSSHSFLNIKRVRPVHESWCWPFFIPSQREAYLLDTTFCLLNLKWNCENEQYIDNKLSMAEVGQFFANYICSFSLRRLNLFWRCLIDEKWKSMQREDEAELLHLLKYYWHAWANMTQWCLCSIG